VGGQEKKGAASVGTRRKVSAKSGRKPPREQGKRREQQRAIETRRAILDAALNEFAERGFEGASIRRIGERASLDWTLITYHFRNKDLLWRAVAIDAFSQMEAAQAPDPALPAAESVRRDVWGFLQLTIQQTAFHHFMLQENHGSSPRLKWLVKNVLSKQRERIVPKIRQAQAEGKMLQGDSDLVYYMLIGMVSVLSSLKDEIKTTVGISHNDPRAIEAYWRLVESAVFK
jgi:AcrR family transcriptional regulator